MSRWRLWTCTICGGINPVENATCQYCDGGDSGRAEFARAVEQAIDIKREELP